MAFTYNSTLVGSSSVATIRFMIGDTSTADQLLQDAEITGAVTLEGDTRSAAARAAESIAASFARKADSSMGKLSLKLSQKSKAYSELAERLRRENGLRVAPTAGGISISAKQDQEADTDRVTPAFAVGMMDQIDAQDAGTPTSTGD